MKWRALYITSSNPTTPNKKTLASSMTAWVSFIKVEWGPEKDDLMILLIFK
jgi:hypothetical protein